MDLDQIPSNFDAVLPVDVATDIQITDIYERRRQLRHQAKIREASQSSHSLAPAVQNRFLQMYLADGWGKLAHGLARQLKSPGRYGLKLVDVALLVTIHDRSVAAVNPVMFAAISTEEFAGETGMDESNIRSALRALVRRGALLKIQTSGVNFWGLNPHYFALKGRGNLTQGHLPQGNAPRDKQGNLPGGELGQTTPGQPSQEPRNQKEISAPKNHIQESLKESSLSVCNFPSDMNARWNRLEQSGADKKARNEREIFEKLFVQHGKAFFDHCGRVVEFLETQGNGKSGEEGRIHSPMIWIQNHWEQNFSRYQVWKAKEAELKEAHAKRLDHEAKRKVENALVFQQKSEADRADAESAALKDKAALRLLSLDLSKPEFDALVYEALEFYPGRDFVRSQYEKYGWEGLTVRNAVLDHFLRVESGERNSKITSKIRN